MGGRFVPAHTRPAKTTALITSRTDIPVRMPLSVSRVNPQVRKRERGGGLSACARGAGCPTAYGQTMMQEGRPEDMPSLHRPTRDKEKVRERISQPRGPARRNRGRGDRCCAGRAGRNASHYLRRHARSRGFQRPALPCRCGSARLLDPRPLASPRLLPGTLPRTAGVEPGGSSPLSAFARLGRACEARRVPRPRTRPDR